MQDLGEQKLKPYSAAEQRRELEDQRWGYWRSARAVLSLFCPHCYYSCGAAPVPTGGIKVSHILTSSTLLHPFLPPSWRQLWDLQSGGGGWKGRAGTTDSGGLSSNISVCLRSHLSLLLSSIGGKYGIT